MISARAGRGPRIRFTLSAAAIIAAALIYIWVREPADFGGNAADSEAKQRPEVSIEKPADPVSASAHSQSAQVSSPSLRQTEPAQSQPATNVASLSPAALPPTTSPLVEHIDELETRAKRGDAKAACRLALDLELCAQRQMLEDSEEFFIRAAAKFGNSSTDARTAEVIQSTAERLARANAVCEGLPEERVSQRWRDLLRAAELGVPDAVAGFAGETPLSQEQFLDQLDGWNAFKNDVPAMLQRAALAGHPSSMYLLQRIYAGLPAMTGGYQPFPPDSRKAAIYAMVLLRFADASTASSLAKDIAKFRATAAPASFAQAEAEAANLFDARFANTPSRDFASGWNWDATSDKCGE